MVLNPGASNVAAAAGAVIVDSSVVIAICAKEASREPRGMTELKRYSAGGYRFYAPGVLAAEALYVLCGKEQSGVLDTASGTGVVAPRIAFTSLLPRNSPEPSPPACSPSIRTFRTRRRGTHPA